MPTMTLNFALLVDNTDVLSGSDLEAVPFSGMMAIFAASTQIDGTVTITTPSTAGVGAPLRTGIVAIRAGPELRKDEDVPLAVFPVTKGDQVTINYDEVTAGSAIMSVVLST